MSESTQKLYQKDTSDPHIPAPALTSAEGGGAIHESSAERIRARRGASLVLFEERCPSCENKGGNRRFEGEASKTARTLGVAGHCSRAHTEDVTWSMLLDPRDVRSESAYTL